MNDSLVSIVIPNYNRANLIGETLDSIIQQTYEDWECIIVDDRSTDGSIEIIKNYSNKDPRFLLIERPQEYSKGANACRNIGKSLAHGKYIIFFDSDDIMLPNHVEEKVRLICSKNYDYAIAKSEYFNNPENKNPMQYRGLFTTPITAENFITKKINWITFDPIIKTEIAKKIDFTEKRASAEEYNYFCKLVLTTENAIATNKVLTKRRYHEGSYQVNLDSLEKILENNFYYFYDTYFEILNLHPNKASKKYLLENIMTILYRKKIKPNYNKYSLYLEIIKVFGILKGLKKIYILVSK